MIHGSLPRPTSASSKSLLAGLCAGMFGVGLASAQLLGQEQDEELRRALASYPHRLLFETNRDGNWELYVMRADGSDPRNLTRTPDVDEVYGKVSPDGRWIAFCADTQKDGVRRRDVWRMRVDGSDRELVAEHARDPFWSPDATELAFLPQEYPRFDFATWATRGLRIHSFATGETRDHPNPELEHLYSPAYTADGRWILATVHGGMRFGHAIVLVEATGRAVHRLGLMGCRADPSPDGRSVTWGFGDYALGLADLEFDERGPHARVDGRIVHNTAAEGQTYHADWSPDGRYVAYSCGPKDRTRGLLSSVQPQCPGVEAPGWDLWVADARGRDVFVRLSTCGRSNKEPDWIPAAAPEEGAGDR